MPIAFLWGRETGEGGGEVGKHFFVGTFPMLIRIRLFLPFSGSGSEHINVSNVITANGNFVAEIKIKTVIHIRIRRILIDRLFSVCSFNQRHIFRDR
jgi:hypothetical protein